jgi:hypothetical protein
MVYSVTIFIAQAIFRYQNYQSIAWISVTFILIVHRNVAL